MRKYLKLFISHVYEFAFVFLIPSVNFIFFCGGQGGGYIVATVIVFNDSCTSFSIDDLPHKSIYEKLI